MEVINISSNGTIVENTSNINNLQINTNIVPSSKEVTEFIINNGQFEFLPSSENVEYFSKVNVAVQIPPPSEANQPLKEYSINSIDVSSEVAIQPDSPYSSMSLVKVNNNFKNKIQDRTIYHDESANYMIHVEPEEGFEAMKSCTVVRTPYIGYLYGCSALGNGRLKEVMIDLNEMNVAPSDNFLIDLEGWNIVIAYKYNINRSDFPFQFESFYIIEFTRVEYFVKAVKLKKGVAYKRFRDVQVYEKDTYFTILSEDKYPIVDFRYPFVWHGDQPRDQPPTLADTNSDVAFRSDHYFFPLLEGWSITSFSDSNSPYELIYEDSNSNNNN